ncbi:MAG: hypothetical protein AB7K67_11590 [Hyphomicrobiaceae bacterium]
MFRCVRCVIALSALWLLGACSMISTEYLGDRSAPIRDGGIAYSLPMTVLRLNIIRYAKSGEYDVAEFEGRGCRNDSKICSDVLTIPDPVHSYIVKFHGSPLSDDEVTLAVDDQGYLSSASGKATDQTGNIIVAATRYAYGDLPAPKPYGDARGAPEPVEQILLNPHNPENMAHVNAHLRKYRIQISCSGACGPSVAPVRAQAEEIYYRPRRSIFLTVSDMRGNPRSMHPLLSFNGSPLIAQRIERSPFITRETTIAFENGMAKSVTHKKPSEGLGLVTVAGNVAGAVVFAPVNALTAQTNAITARQNYLQAREALLQQQTQAMQAAATQAATTAAPATTAAFSDRRLAQQAGQPMPTPQEVLDSNRQDGQAQPRTGAPQQ